VAVTATPKLLDVFDTRRAVPAMPSPLMPLALAVLRHSESLPLVLAVMPAPPRKPRPARKIARLPCPSTVPLPKVSVPLASATTTPPLLPFHAGPVTPFMVTAVYCGTRITW
jgi:hypothetical protein